jgi:hypothetical protein
VSLSKYNLVVLYCTVLHCTALYCTVTGWLAVPKTPTLLYCNVLHCTVCCRELAAVTFVTDKKTRFTCGTKPSYGKRIEALAGPVEESTLDNGEATGSKLD